MYFQTCPVKIFHFLIIKIFNKKAKVIKYNKMQLKANENQINLLQAKFHNKNIY